MKISPRTRSARFCGQSQNGGSEALAGMPIRIAATFIRFRRWTTALMKCVVPITTASTGPRATGSARNAFRASRMPDVTSCVVGRLTAKTTLSSSSSTASVLVPPTSIPMRRINLHSSASALVENGTEIPVVAKSAGADEFEATRARQDGGSRQRHHGDALAVADGFGADRMAGDALQHADQVRRHRDGVAFAPGDDPFVLEREFQPGAAIVIDTLDRDRAAQKAFRGPAGNIHHLADEEPLAAFAFEQCCDRIGMQAVGFAHQPADPDRGGGREVNAPILHLPAGAGCLAGRGDRAHFDADLAAGSLHPFPARYFGDDRLDAARIVQRAGVGLQPADRHRGHLRLGKGASHAIGIDDGYIEVGGSHQRLRTVAAADLDRHHGAEFETAEFLLHLDRAGDVAAVGQALLADQWRPHVGDNRDTIVIVEIQRRHQLHAVALRVELAQVEQAKIGTAAATGAENPGADGEGFDILKRNLGESLLVHATNSSTTRAAAAMARITGPP